MKINLTLSLEEEIVRLLKQEPNYSKLVNEQLEVFFRTSSVENKKILKQNLAELKRSVKEKNKKRREIEKQLIKIAEKEKILRCPQCNKVMFRRVCGPCGIKIELKGGD